MKIHYWTKNYCIMEFACLFSLFAIFLHQNSSHEVMSVDNALPLPNTQTHTRTLTFETRIAL